MEEMLQLEGLKYISCGARPSGKRGGGAAILLDTRKYSMETLDIIVPHNLEVQWAIVRPKEISQNSKYKEYLVCSFYSPPASKKNKKLLDHLISTTHALMAKFPTAAVYLGGDRNDLPLAPLLRALPRFVQVVAHNTHGKKIIDVILMNCSSYYAVAEVTAPLLPDNPRVAKPSDHKVPIARPLALSSQPQCNIYRTKTCRPLPDSTVRSFMQWIHSEQWNTVPLDGSTTAQVAAYEKVVKEKVEQLFPEQTFRVTNKDKEFIIAELKSLDRKKKKE